MFKRTVSLFSSPLVITSVLFLLQLGLFLWVTLRPFSVAPKDRTYFQVSGQGSYLSYIRQSKEGSWKIYNSYTTRPSPSIYTQLFFVLIGKIALLFSLDPVFAYMATSIIAGTTLFIATYWFITIVVPKKIHVLAILFTLGIEPGPLPSTITTILSIFNADPAIFSYYQQELAVRHFGLPHHVLAETLGLLLLGNAFLYWKHTSRKQLIIITVLTIAGTLVMPAYNSVLVCTVFVAWFFWSIIHKELKKMMPMLLCVIIPMGIIGFFIKWQLDIGYPWTNFNIDEKRWVTDPELLKTYFFSLLLYLPFTVLLLMVLPKIWRDMHAAIQLLIVISVAWVTGPALLIPLSHLSIFPYANFRLVDGYVYVPIGILATIGLSELSRILNRRRILYIGASLAVIVSASFTVIYTKQIFFRQNIYYSNVYPLNQEWDAIHFLDTVPKRSGILVLKYFGDIIPSYATVRVFLGETPGIIDYDEKYFKAIDFYSGQMTDTDVRAFLIREDISYVYWGADEMKFFKTNTLYPNVLTPVFQRPTVTIFTIKPR